MIYILGVLFAFENIFLLYRYREKFLQKGRALLARFKTHAVSVNFCDEDDSWYLSQSPLLILHGASMGGAKYNNSKESIEQAISNGYQIIEIDIGITADNELVLTHRFSPDDEIIFESRPNLNEFLLYGALEGETALTLKQFVELCKGTDVYFLIDCAHGIEYKVCEWIRTNVSVEQRRYLIFQVHTPEMLKKIFEESVFTYIHYNGTIENINSIMSLLKTCNVHTCSISDEEVMMNKESFKKLIEAGLHPIVYTVNHIRRLEYILKFGASGIFSDRLQPNDIHNYLRMKG